VRLNGNLNSTNGITVFGEGRLRLGGANTFGGPLTINSGDVRLTSAEGAGLLTGPATEIRMWGGILSLNGSTRHNNNVTAFDNFRLSNDNVSGAAFNNLTVEARTGGSTAPVVVAVQPVAGGNFATAFGGLTLNGPAQLSVVNPLQINGSISGTGSLEKYMNDRFYLGGDSSGYSGTVTAYAGSILSLNASSTAKPFGTGPLIMNPGTTLRIAAPTNVNPGQLTLNSDHGGISVLGMSYVGDPSLIPMTVNSTAPWKGAVGIGAFGFSQNINQSTLWGGDVYLSTVLGDTGTYTGTLSPTQGNRFLLGTGQGTLRMGSQLSGIGTQAIIGIGMTGNDVGRADQGVNNYGGSVQFDVPMNYTGNTIVNLGSNLRLSARDSLTNTGNLILNGGQLQPDSVNGQLRMIAPFTLANNITLTADSTINIQNNASDLRLTGQVSLAPSSNGVARQIFFAVRSTGGRCQQRGQRLRRRWHHRWSWRLRQPLPQTGSGHRLFHGQQYLFGSTTIFGGLIGVNRDADWGNTSLITWRAAASLSGRIPSPRRGITLSTAATAGLTFWPVVP
jgi:autotransporter-associated beta strand protein